MSNNISEMVQDRYIGLIVTMEEIMYGLSNGTTLSEFEASLLLLQNFV